MLTFAHPWLALLLPLPWLVWRFVAALCASRPRRAGAVPRPAGRAHRARSRGPASSSAGAASGGRSRCCARLAADPGRADAPAMDRAAGAPRHADARPAAAGRPLGLDGHEGLHRRRPAPGRPPRRGEGGARRLPRRARGRPRRRRRVRRRALRARAVHHRPEALRAGCCRRRRSAWPARAPRSATRSASASRCSTRSTVPAKTIIALTDGNDTASKVPPAEAAARGARQRASSSTPSRSAIPPAAGEDKLDEAGAEDVAPATGGGFFRALDRAQLAGIYPRLDQIETRKVDTVCFRPKTDFFWLPLLVRLSPCLFVCLRRSREVRRLRRRRGHEPARCLRPLRRGLPRHLPRCAQGGT